MPAPYTNPLFPGGINIFAAALLAPQIIIHKKIKIKRAFKELYAGQYNYLFLRLRDRLPSFANEPMMFPPISAPIAAGIIALIVLSPAVDPPIPPITAAPTPVVIAVSAVPFAVLIYFFIFVF